MPVENSVYSCDVEPLESPPRAEQVQKASCELVQQELVDLEAAFAYAPIGRAYLGPDFRYIRVNRRMASMIGSPFDTFPGKTIREVIPSLADSVESILQQVIDTGEPVFDVEIEGDSPVPLGGRRVWTTNCSPQKDTTGKVVGINVVVEDVTKRKDTERALRRKIEDLEAVFSAVPAAVFMAEDPDCRMMYGNRVTEQMLRLPQGANVSKSAGPNAPRTFRVFRNGVELEPEELPVQRAVKGGKSVRNFELTFKFPDGDITHVYGHAVPLFDEAGLPRGGVGAFVDITDLVETRRADIESKADLIEERTRELVETNARLARQVAERSKAENALFQLQKQEMVGMLATGIAHDFNNVLHIIGSVLAVIKLQESSTTISHQVTTIENAVGQGAGLTKRLLDFARAQEAGLTVSDVNGVIVAVCDLLRQTIRTQIAINHDLASNIWPVMIDAHQLELALLNLAINSRDAMPDGGGLTFTTRNVTAGDKRLPEKVADVDCVSIEVADTGTGMSAELLARSVEPFFTTKEAGRGTGLGLSLVDAFAQQTGGIMRIKSEPGVGTVVEIYLPRT